jgi:hypothetical protein
MIYCTWPSDIVFHRLRTLLTNVCLGALVHFGSACHYMPSVVRSSVAPSGREAEVGKDYVGKSFITNERAYLYFGLFPNLSTKEPRISDRPISVKSGTRFVVNRIELGQGRVADIVKASALGYGDRSEADALYVDLYLDSRVHRNVQLHLTEGGPSFRTAEQMCLRVRRTHEQRGANPKDSFLS